MRASLGTSEEIDGIRTRSLAARGRRYYQPNDYLRVVALALSPRGDARTGCGGCFLTFERKNCAICIGEPNCDLTSQVSPAIPMLAIAPPFAFSFVSPDTAGPCSCLRRMLLATRKPSAAAPASAHGEVSACSAWRAAARVTASTRWRRSA